MTRESPFAKAHRYLAAGRLTVRLVDERSGVVRAECRGDGGTIYRLGYDARGGWRCSCPARTLCAHVVALRLVVAAGSR